MKRMFSITISTQQKSLPPGPIKRLISSKERSSSYFDHLWRRRYFFFFFFFFNLILTTLWTQSITFFSLLSNLMAATLRSIFHPTRRQSDFQHSTLTICLWAFRHPSLMPVWHSITLWPWVILPVRVPSYRSVSKLFVFDGTVQKKN